MAARLGLQPDQAVGKTCYEAVHGLTSPPGFCPHALLLKDQQEHTVEVHEGRIGGDFLVTCTPLRDRDGRLIGSVHVARDITELKRAQRALEESEKRCRGLVEAAPDVVYTISADGRFSSLNPAFERLTGWSCGEWIGRPFRDIVHPADLPLAVETFEAALRGQRPPGYELRIRSKSGNYLVGEFTSTPLMEGGRVIGELGIGRDVTERRRAQEALRTGEERFHELFQRMGSGVAIYEAVKGGEDFIFRSLNAAGERICGATEKDVLGRSVQEAFPGVREMGLFDVLRRVWATGRPENLATTRYADSKLQFWAENYVYRLSSGEVVAIFDDVTKKIQTEHALKQAEEQLRQSQKMDAVGRLAGGIAHDFNNLLTVINNYSRFAADGLRPGDPLRAYIEEIQQAGERAAALTRQLLAFSRRQAIQPRVLRLGRMLAGMEGMLQRLIGEDIELRTAVADDEGFVRADPGQIEQVVMNLAVNARDAMRDGGALTLRVVNAELDDEYASRHVDARAGSYVMLSVTDTGCGMDEETRSHLFEPFFTTKPSGEGTGLGLATIYGIVRQNNGCIDVYTEPGRGTTFKVYLPRERVAAEPPPVAAEVAGPATGSETILLVEDEDSVRNLARRVLAAAGYTVLVARSGGEAFLLCERHDGPIHLMLTDVIMPQMSGRDLADRLAKLRPEMGVLYMSGRPDGGAPAVSPLLPKPFTITDLTIAVRRTLDARRPGNRPA